MKIQFVPLEWVNKTWPLVEAFVASALEHSKGEYTAEHARVMATTGQWQLLVATTDEGIEGAALVQFFNRPNDRVCFIVAIGGKLISGDDTFEQLKNYAASVGATCIEGAVRESVARLWSRYGFVEKYRIGGVKL
jgi:hypothetical protein